MGVRGADLERAADGLRLAVLAVVAVERAHPIAQGHWRRQCAPICGFAGELRGALAEANASCRSGRLSHCASPLQKRHQSCAPMAPARRVFRVTRQLPSDSPPSMKSFNHAVHRRRASSTASGYGPASTSRYAKALGHAVGVKIGHVQTRRCGELADLAPCCPPGRGSRTCLPPGRSSAPRRAQVYATWLTASVRTASSTCGSLRVIAAHGEHIVTAVKQTKAVSHCPGVSGLCSQ